MPTSGFNGDDALVVTLKDSLTNLQGSGTTTLDVISLSAGPSVAVTSPVGLNENAPYTFGAGAIVITDIDAINNSVDSLTLSVSNGKLTLGSTSGLTFTTGSNGSSSLTVTGTLATLNACSMASFIRPPPVSAAMIRSPFRSQTRLTCSKGRIPWRFR